MPNVVNVQAGFKAQHMDV